MSEFFTTQALPLNRLEQLIYSENREVTFTQNGSPASNNDHFMATLMAQLELEMSFDKNIHEKYKSYSKYFTQYNAYMNEQYSYASSILSDSNYSKVNAKDALMKLQVILAELGADDDEINQLNLFGHNSVNNIRQLYKIFSTMEPKDATGVDFAKIAKQPSLDSMFNPVQPNAKAANDEKFKFFSFLVEKLHVTEYFSPPEPNSASGINTFSHLSLVKFLNSSLTTAMPNKAANPFVPLIEAWEYNLKHKYVSNFISSYLTHANLPFILHFIDTGVFDYKEILFFPSLTAILDFIGNQKGGLDTTYSNLVLEMLQYNLDQSAIYERDLNSQAKSRSDSKYYPYSSYIRTFSSCPLIQHLSYDQLVKLSTKCDKDAGFYNGTANLKLLLSKFVPSNFTSLRNNQDVGVLSPYTMSPSSLQTGSYQLGKFYPTRHIADTPIMIFSSSDIEKYKNLIPSFLFTTMDLYKQILSIIKSSLSAAPSAYSGSFKSYYYSALCSFLAYTSDFNVFRFDLFDDDLLPEKIQWSYSVSSGIANWFKDSIGYSNSNFDYELFQNTSFNEIYQLYITTYFSQPTVTSWDQSVLYKKSCDESWLKQRFFSAKNAQSNVIIDISCDQSSVGKNSIEIKSLDNISEELKTTQPPIKATSFIPSITTFDLKSHYPAEYQKVDKFITSYEKERDGHIISTGRQYGTEMKWSDSFKKLKNSFNIDQNGNIRAAITARGINTISVNIYHIDIFSYYQSQLTKGQNVIVGGVKSADLDPNIDLEGLVPHYSTQIDLAPIISSQSIKSYQSFDINLCLDNIPSRGIFMLEALNGQDGIRCCVRKGQYSVIQKKINAGTLLLIINEDGLLVKNPRVYMGIDAFKPAGADKIDGLIDGEEKLIDEVIDENRLISAEDITSSFIFIPSYDTNKTVLLTDSAHSFASCAVITPVNSSFSLKCDWFASVEALTSNITPTNDTDESNIVTINSTPHSLRTGPSSVIGGGNMGAEVLIKPLLTKSGTPIELTNITIVRSSLTITALLESGVTISDTIDNFSLTPQLTGDNVPAEGTNVQNIPSQEVLHTFNVPNNLAKLSFDLICVVEFEGKEHNLSSSYSSTVAQINRTPVTSGMILLRRVNGLYIAYTIDKTGQPMPFTQLRFSGRSERYSSSIDEHLYTDVNGVVELGALFGITSFTLQTVNNDYTFIRGTFSFDIIPYHTTSWPASVPVIVNDDDVEITPSQLKGRDIDSVFSQISLPLPTGAQFDINLFNYLFNSPLDSTVKYNTKLHLQQTDSKSQMVNYPFDTGTFTSTNRQEKYLEFLKKWGSITLTETSSFTSLRRYSPHLISTTPTSIEIYGLRPNRTYHLTCWLGGICYQTQINTFRNPVTKPSIKKQPSFGSQLTPQLYYDRTLTRIADYLVCRGSIIPIKDYSRQLLVRKLEYEVKNETLTIELGNYCPTTSKILLFASNLITTPNDLIAIHGLQHDALLKNVDDEVRGSTRETGAAVNTDFVSGTSISGERDYVMYRRELIKTMKQVGIMLPQPSLLLNKRLRQNTDAIQDQAKEKAKVGEIEKKMRREISSPMPIVQPSPSSSRFSGFAMKVKPQGGLSGSDRGSNSCVLDNAFNSYDIMKYKSSLLLNISPDDNGLVTIKRNGLNKYTTLTLIAYETKSTQTNSYGFNAIVLDIPQTAIRAPLQDLTNLTEIPQAIQPSFVSDTSFTLTLQPHKQYTEEHRCGIIQPTESLQAFIKNDITTTTTTDKLQQSTIIGPNTSVELEIVTSRQDLYTLLLSLLQTSSGQSALLPRRNYSGQVDQVKTALQRFHFIPEWDSNNDNAKLTLLDRHACHELHLFIFFQDRPFFESTLRLHLANKIKKDIVDLWLLSQEIAVTDYTTNVNNINTVELLKNIKNETRIMITAEAAKLVNYNVAEQIMILSVVDPVGLNQLAKQMKSDNNNASLDRNNLTWVTIFESCLRRTMLKLNTTLPDTKPDDDEDDSDDDKNDSKKTSKNKDKKDKPRKKKEKEVVYEDEGDDCYEEEEQELRLCADEAPVSNFLFSSSRAAPQMQMQCAPCPPPPPCASESMAFGSSAPAPPMAMKCLAAPVSRSAAAPMRSMARGAAPGGGGPQLDSLAVAYEKENKPSSIPSYKPLEKTGEYEEKTWYIDAKYDGDAYFKLNRNTLVQWSSFWVDFALHLSNPKLFSIDNDFSTPEKSNSAFASSSILDLVNASHTEYLLCLSITQLSPEVISKQAVIGSTKGHEIINSSAEIQATWNVISSHTNSTQPISNALNTIAKGANYRFIKHTAPTYPIIFLHKQVQQLGAVSSDKNATSLNAAHYYVDIFETMQKGRQIYVQPDAMFKRRAYMCKTVISNMSPEPIKAKVLVTIPDGTTSLSFVPPNSYNSNQTHLNYLQSRTIYCQIPSYSSYVIQYSFLLGNRDSYTHYGTTISSTNSTISQLYCFVPSLQLQCTEYKNIINRRDAITIAREAPDDELCEYLTQYYHLNNQPEDLVTVDDGLDERSIFKLDYILFRFSPNYSQKNLQQRWELYMRIYNIIRGYLSNGANDQPRIHFMGLCFSLMKQNEKCKVDFEAKRTTEKPFVVAKSDCINISHSFAAIYRRGINNYFSFAWKSCQHLEYLPLVAARIHNASMGTDLKTGSNSQTQSSNIDKDIFIPDKQLKVQYTETLNYCLVHSSSVKNIPAEQLLSLIYYAIILNQNIRVTTLLNHLLNTISARYKADKKALPLTSRVQLAYMLIYIDVSTYGQLQSTLNAEQLDVIATIYNNPKITALPSSHQTTYGLSLLLAQMYEKYPIKQWKLLFLQTLQYLNEGQVIITPPEDVNAKEDSISTNSPSSITITPITDKDYDINVAGMSSLQRDLRQDIGSNTTPSLAISTKQELLSTNVTINYSNLSPKETHLSFEIHYIDSELLLSHKPFMTSTSGGSDSGRSAQKSNNNNDQITKPHLCLKIPIPAHTINTPGVHSMVVPIPSHLSKEAQLTLRAPATHLSSTTPLLHSSFTVQVLSKQGIIAVLNTATGKPISGAYVKSYVGAGNTPSDGKFLCDKYTDIRGKASFVDASNNKTSSSNEQFALIVSHPNFGTTVVYTKGPQQ